MKVPAKTRAGFRVDIEGLGCLLQNSVMATRKVNKHGNYPYGFAEDP